MLTVILALLLGSIFPLTDSGGSVSGIHAFKSQPPAADSGGSISGLRKHDRPAPADSGGSISGTHYKTVGDHGPGTNSGGSLSGAWSTPSERPQPTDSGGSISG
jgi:hypothetical protein